MASIDERVVSMAFENARFEAGIAQTMASLAKLDASLQKIGQVNSLGDIEKAASKVTLEQPMSALDKLRARFSRAGEGASEGFNEITKAANKVDVTGASSELDKVQARSADVGRGAADGFNEISKAASKVDVSGATNALDSIQAKFSLLEGAAAVAFGGIAAQAATKGAAIGKSLTLGPITQGLDEYTTNLNSIQTILANTQFQGATLDDVNAALQQLNTYSDQTIYNFGQMAKNIGTFTAAGVDLDTSVSSIKGIANLAALSGSNSQQASTAMYQLSQAIAAGRVGLQDWNSVVNAGMGGATFQRALATTASNMGSIEKGALKIDKATGKATINGQSFRESITARPGEQSWLTSDVLTKTLGQFTGDLTDAQLKAQGFNAEQIKAIQQTAQTARKAATEVKTLGGVFDVVKESIGSGWAKTFQLIFGDFEQSKKLFTDVTSFITDWTSDVADARNKMLGDWQAAGGRDTLLQGLKSGFEAIMGLIKPIRDAFRDIFPATSGKQLADITQNFADLMASLKPGTAVVEGIHRTFRGLFAVLHIGWSIVKGTVGVIGDLLGVVGKGSGGFLNFTGSIGDFLVAIDNALTKGGLLTTFFDGLSGILKAPLSLLSGISGLIFGLFGGGDAEAASKFSGSVDQVNESLKPAAKLLNDVKRAWEGFKDLLSDIRTAVEPWLSQIADEISNFADIVADAIKNANWDSVFLALQTSFLGGLFLVIKKAIGGGISDIGGGLLSNVNDVLKGVTGNLQAMQQKIKADALKSIAISIGILAAAILVISLLDADKVETAMTAIAVGLGELMGAMALLTKIGGGPAGMASIVAMSFGMVALSGAILILAGAMTVMSKLDWEELAKGLSGVGGVLLVVGATSKAIGPSLLPVALAMIPLAIGLNLLALAVKQFASLKWEDLGKGLFGLGAALGAIALGMVGLPGPLLAATGAGLILVGAGMILLAGAVTAFSVIPFEKMLTGLFGVAASLAALGLAIMLIPPTVALQAAGLLILSVALQGIAAAIAVLGNLGIGAIIKGLTAIAGALVIFAIGLTAMAGTLPGAVALLAAAAALAILAPAIALLGNLKWGTIIKGLGAIALTLGVLSVVGLIAAPGLLALGGAIALLGLALLPTAGAMYIFAKALSLLAENGQKGIATLLTALTAFVALLPTIVINFVKGLVSIVTEVVKLAPELVSALGIIIGVILATVIDAAPKLGQAIGILLAEFLNIVEVYSPRIINAGMTLILNFLSGIDRNIGQVVSRVANIIAQFLTELARQAPRIVAGGASLLVAYLKGIANNLPKVITSAANVALTFLRSIIQQIPKFVEAGTRAIVSFLRAIGKRLPSIISAGVDVVISFLKGIGNAAPKLVKQGLETARKFLTGLANGLAGLADVGFKAIIKFLHGLERAIRENTDPLFEAGAGVADAIIDGLVDQFGKLGGVLRSALENVFKLLPGWAKDVLGIASPSKVFMEIGHQTMMGMVVGLGDFAEKLRVAITHPLATAIHGSEDQLKDFRQFLNRDFKVGVQGTTEDIRGSFQNLNQKITDSMQSLKDTLSQDKDKLKELMVPGGDQEAVNRTWLTIQANEALLKRAKIAQQNLMISFKDEKKALIGLSKDFDTVTKKLEAAEQTLDEATRTRNDSLRSLTDQFSQLPDFDEEAVDKVATFKDAMRERIIAVTKYRETLEKLRTLGLDDVTFQKLLSEGTKDQAFVDQLLATGKTGVDQLNTLNKDLLTQAATLAKQASTSLYQAGVDAAAGLVAGLKKEQANIRATMEFIATEMVRAIKNKLRIRSPSQIFAEVGKFAAEGVAQGLQSATAEVVEAAVGVGDAAVQAMQTSMSRISDVLSSEVDTDLTITPVLDLTRIQEDAKKLQDLTNVTPITAAASFGLAGDISAGTAATAEEAAAASDITKVFQFEQNNYSPEALSDVEIYRQTRNQLTQVKSALGLATTA